MNFISVHKMLDPQVDAVRDMSDAVAERIANMGGERLTRQRVHPTSV